MFVTFITIDISISSLVKFGHYRDTRAAILDPCTQGIFGWKLYFFRENKSICEKLFRVFCFVKLKTHISLVFHENYAILIRISNFLTYLCILSLKPISFQIIWWFLLTNWANPNYLIFLTWLQIAMLFIEYVQGFLKIYTGKWAILTEKQVILTENWLIFGDF